MAEKAAFINTARDPPKSPVFVLSQRGIQIFMMAAYFDAEYATYIRNSGPVTSQMTNGFMRIMTLDLRNSIRAMTCRSSRKLLWLSLFVTSAAKRTLVSYISNI